MDVDDNHPGEARSETFDFFLCHGKHDKDLVEKNVSKPAAIIGYPRYDNLPSSFRELLTKEFDLATNKPTIIWLPTRVDWETVSDNNIYSWLKEIGDLTESYNVICRPHPHRVINNPNLLDALKNYGIKIDTLTTRNIAQLYMAADFIFCDYGGSIFSSVYFGKKLLILNSPDHSCVKGFGRLDFKIREKVINISPFDSNRDRIINILRTERLFNAQSYEIKILRKAMFEASFFGKGAKVTADLLRGFLSSM
jgi:hypothetical protein